jgi:hypothetical protein
MPCDSITPVELEAERPNAMGRILLAAGSGGETERIAATGEVEAAAATERGVASADG